ncbi:MAG TPA: VOC family protein [Trebonia sp.]|jgi:catechol 2,3-dioxygenase-like lactoylglutathione lyase family enzyme|nr:VOC family protein [Trebonia sp.]
MGFVSGLHHVQLAAPVGSEPRMREFFAGVLGLAEADKPADLAARGGAWFRGPGFDLHVGIEKEFVPARKAHPALLVDDLDALAARLAKAGHPVQRDNLLVIPGGGEYAHFYVNDPVGNRLEFLQRVA